jgi:hypothetical protein
MMGLGRGPDARLRLELLLEQTTSAALGKAKLVSSTPEGNHRRGQRRLLLLLLFLLLIIVEVARAAQALEHVDVDVDVDVAVADDAVTIIRRRGEV